ncbi:hypothetical protein NBRC10513v2_006857 [Rhodotorula toruloides]|uniref:Proteolipid membrane potential modulator-domain containing protein n=1 Tax=Rhodotorula toruloides TaxID=5286 RepID=A0A2T0A2V6_RHOTO|nr:Proteolipid membrane potential modulator-domain containing protein [Rhodotorula toruloides]
MVRTSDILIILVAILFPPAAAALLTGCSCDLLINLLLTLLGYIPGHLHAFYLLYKRIKSEERYGEGNLRYVGNAGWAPIEGAYAPVHPHPHAHPGRAYGAPPPQGTTTYGTA